MGQRNDFREQVLIQTHCFSERFRAKAEPLLLFILIWYRYLTGTSHENLGNMSTGMSFVDSSED